MEKATVIYCNSFDVDNFDAETIVLTLKQRLGDMGQIVIAQLIVPRHIAKKLAEELQKLIK